LSMWNNLKVILLEFEWRICEFCYTLVPITLHYLLVYNIVIYHLSDLFTFWFL